MLKYLSPFTRHGSASCPRPTHRPPEPSPFPLQPGEEKMFWNRRAKLCKMGIACISWLWNSRNLPLVNLWVQMFEGHSLSVGDKAWHRLLDTLLHSNSPQTLNLQCLVNIDIFKMFTISDLRAATCCSCWVWAWVSTWLAGWLLPISRLRSFMTW